MVMARRLVKESRHRSVCRRRSNKVVNVSRTGDDQVTDSIWFKDEKKALEIWREEKRRSRMRGREGKYIDRETATIGPTTIEKSMQCC
jgi:hypothetical protein